MYYRGIDLTSYLKILDIRRDLLPPVSLNLIDIPGRHGKRFVKSTLKERTVEVDVEIKGRGRENLRRELNRLADILYTGKPEKLIFTDEIDKYYLGIIKDTTFLQEIYLYGITTLRFICPDPYKYSTDIIHLIENNKKFYNPGSAEAPGIVELTLLSDTDNIIVKNLSTGEHIEMIGQYKKGDEITIDLEKENVLLNGENELTNITIGSDFFKLIRGENHIKIPEETIGKLIYKERWL